MTRQDTSAREACEAAAAWKAPRVPGTVVTTALALGQDAAVVQTPSGVLAAPVVDVEDPDVVVLAWWAELSQLREDGMGPADVGRLLTAREARAFAAVAA